MKISALLTLLVAALLVALPTRRVHAQEASFDLFYNSLADDGDWYNTPDFGYVWHPAIADGNDKWRPYTDGYWAQTDDGWAWVSYESFGWATYHYGRWIRLESVGWAWVPGYQWGPGWVSWRTSDDYIGWAPLPPRAEHAGAAVSVDYNTVESVDDGYTAAVDTDYDIGPDNYCFVGVRQFGAPVLSEVILPFPRNALLIGSTVNVTNIYYRRGPDRTVVYNTGPDFAFISAHVERPIQRLRIDRREDLAYLRDNGHGANPTVVKNGVLLVAAPIIARRVVNFEQVKPVRVKQVIAQPQIVHGWTNAGSPAQVQLLRERVKTQAQAAPRQARADLPPQGVAPVIAEPSVRERTTVNSPPVRERTTVNSSGQGPTDADRVARRDAAQREKEARDQKRAADENPPVKTATAPSGGENPPNKAQTQTVQERLARKQAQQNRDQAPAPAAQTPAPNARAERQEVRSTPPPHTNQAGPNGDQATHDARRAERQQPPQPQGAAAPEHEAHRNDRQPAPTQAQGNPQPADGDDKKKKENN